MKTNRKFFLAALLIAACSMSVRAQQVNTLYFLENAPMRHTINPAFQPVSKGYVNFSTKQPALANEVWTIPVWWDKEN